MENRDTFPNSDFHQRLEEFQTAADAILLDVRSAKEYQGGHLDGSMNVPLKELAQITEIIKEKDAPVFLYCYSGGRSRQAYEALKNLGYTNVTDMGGIAAYNGKLVNQ